MTDIYTDPISTLGLHTVVRELLLISRPAEGRRLSWPEDTVGYQLAQGSRLLANDPSLERDSNPRRESYELDRPTLPDLQLHPPLLCPLMSPPFMRHISIAMH